MLRIVICMAIAFVASWLISGFIVTTLFTDKELVDAFSLGIGVLIGGIGMTAGLIWDARSVSKI